MTDDIQKYLDDSGAFHELLTRASFGDRSTIPALRELLTVPGLSTLGDIFSRTEQALLSQLVGNDLWKRESVTHYLDALEQSLSEGVQSIYVILIRQVRNDMLMLSLAQQRAIERRDVISDRLLSTAHKRLMTSLRTLHTLQRVLPKVQVNIGTNQINLS